MSRSPAGAGAACNASAVMTLHPRVRAGIAAARRDQAVQVVLPAVRVLRGRLGAGQVAMREAEQRACAARLELEDDRARAGRHGALARLPAPRVDEAPG